jgi:hypothetical protein
MPKDIAFNVRGRGSYASQACNVCRLKYMPFHLSEEMFNGGFFFGRKIKCDGNKPVCGSCDASGRDGEVSSRLRSFDHV